MKASVLFLILCFTVSCVQDDGQISRPGSSQGGGPVEVPPDETVSSPSEDPLAIYAWHLNNTGQNSFSSYSGSSGEDISLRSVHEELNILGRGVRIAVSDTGIDIEHPDLSGNTLASEHRNYASNNSLYWQTTSPLPSTSNEYHGTGVAGLVSAIGWNGIGSRGVAPESKFAAFRFIYSPSASETASSRLAKKLDQISGDFDIFNYSYGYSDTIFYNEDAEVDEALLLGVTNGRNGKGSIYVQSAGNGYSGYYLVCEDVTDPDCVVRTAANTNAHSGLATPYKIVVGAVNAEGYSASYSTPGSGIWVSAPGGEDGLMEPAMITTDLRSCSSGNSYRNINKPEEFNFSFHPLNPLCDYMNDFNGTSSSAPVVSGVVALMLEANPNLSWRDVKHILATTADQIDYDPFINTLYHPWSIYLADYTYDYKWVKNQANIWFSNWYGFGRVNADKAVREALNYDLGTLGEFEQTINSSGVWYYRSGNLVGRTITDESPYPQEDKIWVGHDYVIETVQIKITTDHPAPGELAIHLVSPSGTESRLLNINSYLEGDSLEPETIMISNAFYGESSEGFWTIKVYDGSLNQGTGDLLSWEILISGHRSEYDLSLPYPVTNISPTTQASQSLTSSPVFAFTKSLSHDSLITYQAAVGVTPDDESAKGWANIGLTNYGHQIDGMSLNQGQTYYLKIRAVGPYGFSSIQIKPFMADSI